MKTTLCKILMIVLSVSLTLTPLDAEARKGGRSVTKSAFKAPKSKAKIKKAIRSGFASKVAKKISSGHALKKHGNEFSRQSQGKQRRKMKKIARDSIINGEAKPLERSRVGYWNKKENANVIYDPNHSASRYREKSTRFKVRKSKKKHIKKTDLGTMFKPRRGRAYFNNLQ